MLLYAHNQRRYDEFQKNVGNKMVALQQAVQRARLEQSEFDRDYNLHLSQERRRREMEARQRDTEENYKEILNNFNGVLLTETPDVFNIGGGHK